MAAGAGHIDHIGERSVRRPYAPYDARIFLIRHDMQFSAHPISMLESPAFRVLSASAYRVIARIEIELAHHGANDNGRLPVTYEDFVDYGIVREAENPHRCRCGKPAPKTQNPRCGKPTLQGQSGNPHYFYISTRERSRKRALASFRRAVSPRPEETISVTLPALSVGIPKNLAKIAFLRFSRARIHRKPVPSVVVSIREVARS